MGDINKQGHAQQNIMLVVELQLHPLDSSSQKNNKNKVPFIYLNTEVQGNNIYTTLSAISSMHAPIILLNLPINLIFLGHIWWNVSFVFWFNSFDYVPRSVVMIFYSGHFEMASIFKVTVEIHLISYHTCNLCSFAGKQKSDAKVLSTKRNRHATMDK